MRTFVTIVLVFLSVLIYANKVSNKPYEFTQPDGSKLSLLVSGDEFYHRVHDQAGYTILKHPETGYAVYAIPAGESIRPSDYIAGRENPAVLGMASGLRKKDPALKANRDAQIALRNSRSPFPSMASVNAIVCYIRFNDETEFPATPTFDDFAAHFNSYSQESMKEYYEEVSLNRLHITSHFYPAEGPAGNVVSIQVENDRDWYQPYSYSDNPQGYTTDGFKISRMSGLVREVVDILQAQIPGSLDVDVDNNDVMDALIFVIRGEDDAWGDLLWPAYWSFDLNCGEINTADVLHCILTFETDFDTSIVCHEMGHNIGFPDMYHYSEELPWDDISPCWSWDQMDYNNTQHSLCYNKWKYGQWFDTINVLTPTSTPTVYTLAAVTPANPYPCYKILSSNPNQFYMLEYRRDEGRYENGIPDTGLIVYRVNTNCGNGNADGPPDEVYVYRPGGVVNTNGTPDEANFSAETGRTSIHNYTDPKPWLWVNDSTTPDGNLVITNVGSTSGNTIQFTLQNFIPYTWNGSANTSWSSPANWNQNSVPGATDYVEIPGGCPRYPELVDNRSCYHLAVKAGANILLATSTLTVETDFFNYGELILTTNSARLEVRRDLKFYYGSSAEIISSATSATIAVQRNLEFFDGCLVDLSYGFIELFGTQHGYIRTYYPYVAINHLRSAKTGGFASGIGEVSTDDLSIRGNIDVLNGSKFNHYYTGTTRLYGGFYAYTGSTLVFTQGILSMEGNENKVISIADASNYLNNLSIHKSDGAQVSLSTNVDVRGVLFISTGVLNSNTYNIKLRGDWYTNMGSPGFLEGTGTVSLTGTLDQHISSETFYRLELNKTGGALLVEPGNTIYSSIYDWTQGNLSVSGGSFIVTDLADEGIFGTVTVTDGLLEFQQDNATYCDLRGTLNISGGTVKIKGTAGTNYLSYIDIGTLNMSGGVLDYVHQGMAISADYLFNDNIMGGTIRTGRGFSVYRQDFNPSGGTIELYGSTDATLHMTLNPGSNFRNVTINKSATREDSDAQTQLLSHDRDGTVNPITRINSVTGSGLLNIDGNFTLEAGSFTAPDRIKIAGNWNNLVGPNYFNQGTGVQTVEFDGVGYQYCNYPEVFNILQLNKSASSLRLNLPSADLQCNTYSWANGKIQVYDGVFSAWDLSQNGIYGNFEVVDDGIINLYQDVAQTINVNGFLYTEGGQINIYGGSASSFLGSGGAGGFIMHGGIIDFKDKGITIQTVATPFTFDITAGAVIRTAGSWFDSRGNVWLDDCRLEMYGSTNNTISSGTGSYFYDLTIDKAAANYVGSTSSIRIDGTLNIVNCSFLTGSSNVIAVGNDVNVYGILSIGTGSQLKLAGGTGLKVFDGAVLESIGSSTNNNYITHNVTGYYTFDVEPGATISAVRTYFEYMSGPGVNIKNGAFINTTNSFNYCTFRYGSAGGTLLSVDNSQTLTLNSVAFPTNAGGGAKNVSKTNNQGTLLFLVSSGTFSGPSYENDPNSRIFWGETLQRVPTPVISYDSNQNQIWLDWVYPITCDYFKILGSMTPDGPWAQVGTSTTTSWHHTVPGAFRFYQVKAVRN